MLTEILTFLNQNQLVTGGLLLGFFYFIQRNLSRILGWIHSILKRYLLLTIDFGQRINQNSLVNKFEKWLQENKILLNAKNTEAYELGCENYATGGVVNEKTPNGALVPGFGLHWFFYKKRFCLLLKYLDKKENGNDLKGYYFTIFSRKRELMEEIVQQVANTKLFKDDSIGSYIFDGNFWSLNNILEERSLESVILEEQSKSLLINDIKDFFNNEKDLLKKGLPAQRCYLLHGPPGNGKTSTIKMIASHFKRNICPIYLSRLDKYNFSKTFKCVPKNSIILLEDVDCFMPQREDKKGFSDISLGDLLNTIDGVDARNGQIIFMTTNHIEKLDPALIRSGRCNQVIEIKNPSPDLIEKYLRYLYNTENPKIGQIAESLYAKGVSMADVQKYYLENPIV